MQFLNAIGVKHSVAPDLGVNATYFLLPEASTIVFFLRSGGMIHNNSGLTGFTILTQLVLRQAAQQKGLKLVTLSYPKFLREEDGQSRLAYLSSVGIVPAEGKTSFDFSDINFKSKNKPRSKETKPKTQALSSSESSESEEENAATNVDPNAQEK